MSWKPTARFGRFGSSGRGEGVETCWARIAADAWRSFDRGGFCTADSTCRKDGVQGLASTVRGGSAILEEAEEVAGKEGRRVQPGFFSFVGRGGGGGGGGGGRGVC